MDTVLTESNVAEVSQTGSASCSAVKEIASTNSSQISLDTPYCSNSNSVPNSPMLNGTSTTYEDYELGTAIGFGSTAIVHAGRHLSTNAPIAIKVFDLDRFEQLQIDRLRQELCIMSLCKTHDNLLSHSACITKDNELWLVMPLCSAGSMADVLKWSFPDGLEESVIACILVQALAGLAHLHASGHCHRDVKAANLLLDCDGTIKLGDFGVSASLDSSGCYDSNVSQQTNGAPLHNDNAGHANQKIRRKTFVGTPCWMAPEIMEGSGYDGEKADIWSLGILALELAYGQAPYAKYPPMKVIYLTLSASTSPTLERERCKHKYSRTFKDFIDSCLQRAPDKRPSAEGLLKHPLIRSAKKPAYLVEKLVNRCPPITARNIQVNNACQNNGNHTNAGPLPSCLNSNNNNGSCGNAECQSNSVEWDFSDSDGAVLKKGTDGNVSRRGRFIVTDCIENVANELGDVHLKKDDSEQEPPSCSLSSLQDLLLKSNIYTCTNNGNGNSTIRKGRFSIECDNTEKKYRQHEHLTVNNTNAADASISVPAIQFEQLCLLVDMLKDHMDSISHSQKHHMANSSGSNIGQHRRSSTSLGKTSKRESTELEDRRDSLQ